MKEEEAEEEGEAERMAEWDRGAADAAYKLQVEKAQQQQLLLDQEAAAWVSPLSQLPPSSQPFSLTGNGIICCSLDCAAPGCCSGLCIHLYPRGSLQIWEDYCICLHTAVQSQGRNRLCSGRVSYFAKGCN